MRAILPVLALALAGCGPAASDNDSPGAAGERVACAKRASAPLVPECVAERSDSAAGPALTIRHPDGGFRRLLITRDGRGVIAADGAEPAVVTISGADRIAVAVGGERYELPATFKHAAKP